MLISKSYKHKKRKAGKGNQRTFCRSFGKGVGLMKQILKNAPCMDPATHCNGEVLEGAEEWSLRVLMASCHLHFAEEMTALQHVGNELGVPVIILPKFHAELAGEGIAYSWGVTKGLYRQKPLHSERSKEAFKGLVIECTSRDIL
jgi:hypothetical protein